MKKTMRFLCMATLVAMGTIQVSCVKPEDEVTPQPKDNIVTLTTTVGFEEVSGTKGQRVNGNKGLVIYPDGYNGNEYQGNNWNEFETAGCIFLPAAFSRLGQTVYTGEEGSYWSSSPSEVTANSMHFIYLNDTWIVTSDNAVGRPSGLSVRLVRPVN